jgi:hypothetical protein
MVFSFPFIPVVLQMSVRDVSLSRMNSVVVVGKVSKDVRNVWRRQVVPRSVVVSCSVPVSIVRTVPVPGVQEEIETDIRCEIGITTGNQVDSRRCRYYNRRRRWNTDSNMKIYISR